KLRDFSLYGSIHDSRSFGHDHAEHARDVGEGKYVLWTACGEVWRSECAGRGREIERGGEKFVGRVAKRSAVGKHDGVVSKAVERSESDDSGYAGCALPRQFLLPALGGKDNRSARNGGERGRDEREISAVRYDSFQGSESGLDFGIHAELRHAAGDLWGQFRKANWEAGGVIRASDGLAQRRGREDHYEGSSESA